MASFPDVAGAPSGYQRTTTYKTLTSRFGADALPHVVAYRKWFRPRYTFTLSWDALTAAQMKELQTFLTSTAQGSKFTFNWFDWKPFYWTAVPVSTGNGSLVTFDLPAKESSDHAFYVNGTLVTGNVAAGAGTEGQDRVTLSAPVPSGARLTANFYGRRRFVVCFGTQPSDFVPAADALTYSFNTTLVSEK